MDNLLYLFPKRWTEEPEREVEWLEGDEEEALAKKEPSRTVPAVGSIVVAAAAGSVVIKPPQWHWHTDEEDAVARVRRRLLVIIWIDLMVFGWFVAAMCVVKFTMNRLSFTLLSAARIISMRRLGFRDLGLTIAGAQMAVTMNLFFLALGAASTAVMSHVNTTYVCPLGNNPSRYWWYMGIYFPNMPDKFICSAVLWDLTMSGSFVGTSVFAISLARRLETSYTLKANLEDALRIVALTFFNTPQNAGAPPAGATAGAGILLAPPATAAAARAEEIAAGKRKAVVLVEAATGRTREQAGAAPRRYTVAGPATARLYLPPPPAVPLSSSGSGASTSQAGVAGVLRTSSAGSSIGGGHGRKRRAGGVIEIVPPARRRSSGIGSRNSSSSSSLQQLDAAVSGAAQAATMLLSPRPGAEASPSASSSDGAKWTPRPQDPAAAGGETTSGGAAAAEQPSAVPAAAKRIDMLVAASAATATTAADQTGTIQRRSSSSALAAEGGSMTLSRRHSSQADGGGEQDLAFSLLAPSPAVLRSRLPSSDATMGDAGVGDVEIVMGSSSDSGGSGGDITGRGSYGAAGDGSSVLPQKEEENSGVTVTEIPGTAEKAAPDHVQPTEQLLSYPVPEEVPARRSVTASARAALSSWWALRARTEAVLGGGASSKVQPTTGESQVKQQSRRSVSPSLRLQNGGTAASGLLGAANGSPRIPPLLVSEPANLLASREEGSGMA